MNKKILYVYGYGSNPKESFTMKELSKVINNLGYNLVSIEYDQNNPNNGLKTLEKYIRDNKIKYVIGHSLGGFITMCIDENVKKIVINPCMKPSIELPKISNISNESINYYKSLENWLNTGIGQIEEVIGLFGDHDELIDYYDSFKNQYASAYRINSDHRPKAIDYTEDIKKKIKEFFS